MLSVKNKIIIIFTSITILLVLLMARVSYVTVKENYLQQSEEHVKMLSIYMASMLDQKYLALLGINRGQVREEYTTFLQVQAENSGVANVFLFNKNLHILANGRENISSNQLQLNRSEILLINPGNAAASFPFADEAGNWYIWGFYRINEQFFLGVQESASRLKRLNDLANTFLAIGIAGIIVTILAGWFIAHNISRPVDKLVRFSKKIGKGDFYTLPPQKIYGEFRILKDTMEQMKEDLARKNEEREQMLAQIAHEIRNPLGGIELLAGLVNEDLGKDSPQAAHLKKIVQEVQNLKNQLSMFLEYSKPLKADRQEVNLNQLTSEIKQNFISRSKEKKVDLQVENNVDSVYFDNGHLKQVLNNLVTNSLEAAGKGDTVWLRSNRENSNVIISVTDNGPGISQQIEKNIFTPFFTTKASGTGLGLAISKKLCRENNADLEYHNNDQGCTFSVKIQKQVVL